MTATPAAIPQLFPPRLEPLTSAAVVFRVRSGAASDLVVALVSSFLDFATPDRWRIERACERGLGLRMLKRLAHHEATLKVPGAAPPAAAAVDPFYRAYLSSKALIAAIRRSDDLDVVRWICCEYCPSVVPAHAMAEAARCGRLRVLQWLFERYPRVRPNCFIADKAAEGGHLDVLEWVVTHPAFVRPESFDDLLCCAALHSHTDMVKWIIEQQRRASDNPNTSEQRRSQLVLGIALQNGHFELAKDLADAGYTLDASHKRQLLRCAVRGDVDAIKQLHARGFMDGTSGWIDAAASAGHLNVVEYVHENFPDDSCSTDAMDSAARNGHLEVVCWLHEHRTEGCSSDAMDYAAVNGRVEMVQWLHEHRTEGCTTDAMDYAAADGSLELVQFLHANRAEGCTTTAMNEAAANGHLRVAQWLHANRSEGCTTNAMDVAAANGHLAVVQWLHAHRSEGCTTSAMDYAAASGHLEVIEWLHANRKEGCTDFAMDRAAQNGHLETVQWLHANRSEGCTVHALEAAARNGHFGVVKWLHTNREECHSEFAMDEANSIEMLEWLHEHWRGEPLTCSVMNAVHSGNFEKLLFLKEKNIGECEQGVDIAAVRVTAFEIFQWLRVNYPDCCDFDATRVFRDYSAPWEWTMFFELSLE